MKKNRMKFLIIEFLLLLLAVFFVWKIFDQNVAEPRIAVILPESGAKGSSGGCASSTTSRRAGFPSSSRRSKRSSSAQFRNRRSTPPPSA